MKKIRICMVGASYRGMHGFAGNLLRDYSQTHEIAGVYDLTLEHIRAVCAQLKADLPAFTDFDEMLRVARPDIMIIANIDRLHLEFLERSLAGGVRQVVCEKPLCISAEQCRRVRELDRQYADARTLTSHNLRYSPFALAIRDLLDEGAIGRILSFDFAEYLDLDHGTSYYRRWNRAKKNSGGLVIHKASHHFDLMNWFAGSRARTLSAHGRLVEYGAAACPFAPSEIAERCELCPKTKAECRHRSDLNGIRYKLFRNGSIGTGYIPDQCVYSPEIDAEDHLGVSYDYENGIHVNYALSAHSALEGMRIGIEGIQGRLEYTVFHSASGMTKSEHDSAPGRWRLRLQRFGQAAEDIPVKTVTGGHGGADTLLCRDLFGDGNSKAAATLEDGIQAVLIGAAANESMRTGKQVEVQSLAPDPA